MGKDGVTLHLSCYLLQVVTFETRICLSYTK
nr:MAG TPA: hypothetical protein [Caudoviricetes sp.]